MRSISIIFRGSLLICIIGVGCVAKHNGAADDTSIKQTETQIQTQTQPQALAQSKGWTAQEGIKSGTTQAFAVATDSSGNVYVTGNTNQALEGVPSRSMKGVWEVFITKYDSSKAKQWTKQLTGGKYSVFDGNAIAVNSSGDVYIAGSVYNYSGTEGLDGSTLIGLYDAFIAKYSSSGEKLWAKEFGLSSVSMRAQAVATDSTGNAYIAGEVSKPWGGTDFIIAKYDSSGNQQWLKRVGTTNMRAGGRGIVTDSTGVYISGNTTGDLDGYLTGLSDLFVAKYDFSGTRQWIKQFGIPVKGITINGMAMDSANGIYMAGSISTATANPYGRFTAKYDSSGVKQWSQFNTDPVASGIAADSSNNVYVSGDTSIGLEGNALIGSNDIYISKYNSSGTKQWTKQFGATGSNAYSTGIAMDSSGNAFICGFTDGGLDGNSLAGVEDVFVARFDSSGNKN